MAIPTDGMGPSMRAWPAVFTIGNSAIGAGILSFPYAFRSSGLFGGMALCLVSALVVIATLFIVIRQSYHVRAWTYQQMVNEVLGPVCSMVLSVVTVCYLFGACVAYMIVIGDTLHPLVLQVFSLHPDSWMADRHIPMLIAAFAVILPLSLQRSLGAIVGASSVAMLVMGYTTGVVIFRSWQLHQESPGKPWLGPDVQLVVWDWQALSAVPVMLFAFQCHVQSVHVFAELERQPALCPCCGRGKHVEANQNHSHSHTANPRHSHGSQSWPEIASKEKLRGMYWVVLAAVTLIGSLYMLVAIFGYLAFPSNPGMCDSGNILNCFPQDDTLVQVARGLVGSAVMLHYPVTHHSARSALDDLVRSMFGISPSLFIPYRRLIPETLVFFAAALALALKVHNLGKVFKLLGGSGATTLVFIMPGLVLLAKGFRSLCGSSDSRPSTPDMFDIEVDMLRVPLNADNHSPHPPALQPWSTLRPARANLGLNYSSHDGCCVAVFQLVAGTLLVVAGAGVVLLTVTSVFAS